MLAVLTANWQEPTGSRTLCRYLRSMGHLLIYYTTGPNGRKRSRKLEAIPFLTEPELQPTWDWACDTRCDRLDKSGRMW
jgi:hypothetical protein